MKPANPMPPAPGHHQSGRFQNPWPRSQPHGVGGVVKWMLTRSRRSDETVPGSAFTRSRSEDGGSSRLMTTPQEASLPVAPGRRDLLRVTWIGHSSFLIQGDGLNLLTDPVWSDRASPVSFAGPRRLVPAAIRFDDLPEIDGILISHDHYDHLDDRTIRRLASRFPRARWCSPLRVGAFLASRGAASVTELDWWDERSMGRWSVGCTPAQHFSGRYPWNRNSTLWCGWTITFGDTRVFFAGDTGLHPEFRAIADRFGPFDMAILPIGAYEPRWFMRPVHMTPEDSVAAFGQLVAGVAGSRCVMVGSHWGTFRLTDEPVGEPPVLTRAAWLEAGLAPDRLWILAHGESRELSAL